MMMERVGIGLVEEGNFSLFETHPPLDILPAIEVYICTEWVLFGYL